jgi:23S rRNA G2445 N2-methylase RlmL
MLFLIFQRDYIPENGEFPVIGKSLKSELFSVSDCQRIVKKVAHQMSLL